MKLFLFAAALSLSLFLAVFTNPAEAGKFQCISILRPAGVLRLSEFFTQTLNALELYDDKTGEHLHIHAKDLSSAVDPVLLAIQNRETSLRWNKMKLTLSYTPSPTTQTARRVTVSGAFKGVWTAEFDLSKPVTREVVSKELDQRVSFQIKDASQIVGYGDVVFDANQKSVEFRKLYLFKPYRERSIGSGLLRVIHDVTDIGTTLSLGSANDETNSVLHPIISDVGASRPYKITQQMSGQPAATLYFQLEVARRALEVIESEPNLVWLRALQKGGWRVDRIGCESYTPIIYASWKAIK